MEKQPTVTVNGRYPKGVPFYPENMQASVRILPDGSARVRIDDKGNSDFWLEVQDMEPVYEMPDEATGGGIEGARARLRILLAMCDRAPIMRDLVTKAIASLEGVS